MCMHDALKAYIITSIFLGPEVQVKEITANVIIDIISISTVGRLITVATTHPDI